MQFFIDWNIIMYITHTHTHTRTHTNGTGIAIKLGVGHTCILSYLGSCKDNVFIQDQEFKSSLDNKEHISKHKTGV